MYAKKEKTYPAYVSKHNSNREQQVILLMIPNEKIRKRSRTSAMQAKSEGWWWHCLPVKKLSELLRRITCKHHSDFYCLNCLHSFATEKT